MAAYHRMYCIRNGYENAFPVMVRKSAQQGKTVWRSESGTTFADRHICDWHHLPIEAKRAVNRFEEDRARAGAAWAIAKDRA